LNKLLDSKDSQIKKSEFNRIRFNDNENIKNDEINKFKEIIQDLKNELSLKKLNKNDGIVINNINNSNNNANDTQIKP